MLSLTSFYSASTMLAMQSAATATADPSIRPSCFDLTHPCTDVHHLGHSKNY